MNFIDVVILLGVIGFLFVVARFQFFSKNRCKACKRKKSCKNIKT